MVLCGYLQGNDYTFKIGTMKFWEHQATIIDINFMQENPIY